MSQYGDGSLKQSVLDAVMDCQSEHGASPKDMIDALAEIIKYYVEFEL
jgi:hypothetical protein